MSVANQSISLMSADLPCIDGGDVPEWIHLLPTANGEISTGDKRGPYSIRDAQRVIALSMANNARLPIDENHSTDLAAPLGNPAPARGWIVALEARADGIWGQVEWNTTGRALLQERAYRGISPVIMHDPKKQIIQILRASLVNKPNLRGLTALNQESDMTLLERLAQLLGMDAASSENDVYGAVQSLHAQEGGDATALQSQISEIGVALGLGEGGDATSIIEAAKKAGSVGSITPDEVVALQSEIADLTTKLNGVTTASAKAAATSFVDEEIKRGRTGLKPMRDHYIAMHMEDPARVEKEIGAMMILKGNQVQPAPPENGDGTIALNQEQRDVAKMMGISETDFAATLKEERAGEEAL